MENASCSPTLPRRNRDDSAALSQKQKCCAPSHPEPWRGVGRRFRVYIRGKRKVGENIIRFISSSTNATRQYAKRGSHAVLFQRTHWIPAASSAAVTVLQFGTGHEGGGVSTCFFYLQFLQKNITFCANFGKKIKSVVIRSTCAAVVGLSLLMLA